jgi:hypothetical protein
MVFEAKMASTVTKTRNLSEAYDYRVALPLIVVGAFCLLFILVSDHRTITSLKDTSNVSTSTKAAANEPTMATISASGAQTLSPTIQTIDPDTLVTPTTIETATPQSSSNSNTSAGITSGSRLQSATTSSGSSTSTTSSSPTTDQPSQETIENLVNGTTSAGIGITNKTTKGTVNLLNSL